MSNPELTEYIEKNLSLFKKKIASAFPRMWENHFTEKVQGTDYLKLLYSSAFTLHIDGNPVWVDISIPSFADPVPNESIAGSFTEQGLFLCSHMHGDHFDPAVIRQAACNPEIKFAVHAESTGCFEEQGAARSNILPVLPNGEFMYNSLSVNSVSTPHINIEDSIAFHIISPDYSILVLGDLREYKQEFASSLPQPDILLFNLWLGRRMALEFNTEYIESCADFIRRIGPKRTYILHLYEVSRAANDVWTYLHAGIIKERLAVLCPDMQVIVPTPNHIYSLTS